MRTHAQNLTVYSSKTPDGLLSARVQLIMHKYILNQYNQKFNNEHFNSELGTKLLRDNLS